MGEARTVLVSSSGGVLLDVLALRPWWERGPVLAVAVPAVDTRALLDGLPVRWEDELRPRRVLAVLRRVAGAARVLRAVPTLAVVSAGSGVAVPWFVAARLCGVPALWVETLNVVGRPGLAARLCARLATSVVVQHPHLVDRHRRCVLVGELY